MSADPLLLSSVRDLFLVAGMCSSGKEFKDLAASGALLLNDAKVKGNAELEDQHYINGELIKLSRGNYHVLLVFRFNEEAETAAVAVLGFGPHAMHPLLHDALVA